MRRWIVVCAALCLAAVVAFLLSRDGIGGSSSLSKESAARGADAVSVEATAARDAAAVEDGPERQAVEVPAAEIDAVPGELVVSVRSESGEPVADWEVQVEPEFGVSVPSRVQRWRTDQAGRAAREVIAGEYEVRTLGHPEQRCVVAAGERTNIELVLRLDREVTGIVLDPTRQPVPFAQLMLRWKNVSIYPPIDAGRADAAGRFRLRPPARWACSISATAPGFRASAEHQVTAKTTEMELLLGAKPAQLTVVVTRADHMPAMDAWVRVVAGSDEHQRQDDAHWQELSHREQVCDRDGRVRFTDLWPGPASLTIRDADHLLHSEKLELHAGDELLHLVALQRGATLAGTVRDESGAPIAGARIGSRWLQNAQSANDGTYRLGGLDPAITQIEAHHRDYRPERQAIAVQAGQTSTWDPVLRLRPLLRGRLVDASGQPLAQYEVQLHDSNAQHYVVRGHANTGADGRFALKLEDEQPLDVEVRGRGQPFTVVPEGGRQVRPSPDELLLRLGESTAASAWVLGRVDAPALARDGNTHLNIQRLEPGRWGRTTNVHLDPQSLEFRFGPLPPASYRLLLSCADPKVAPHEVARVTLRPDEQRDLGELTLGQSGSLVVEARLAGGPLAEPPYVQIEERQTHKTLHITRCDSAGRLELACPPGTYLATLYGGAFVWQRRELEIRASNTTSWTATLEPAIRRKLFFTLPPGETTCRFEILNPDAVVVFDTELAADSSDSREWHPFFGLGRHQVRATGGSGKLYSQSFVVSSLEPDPRGIRIAPK